MTCSVRAAACYAGAEAYIEICARSWRPGRTASDVSRRHPNALSGPDAGSEWTGGEYLKLRTDNGKGHAEASIPVSRGVKRASAKPTHSLRRR